MRSFLSIVVVAAFVGGCGHAAPSPRLTLAAQLDDDDPDTHLTDLPRGQAAPGNADAVVRVIAHGVPCSGALVGPKLVLTAQHCVAGRDGDEVDVTLPPGYVWIELGGAGLPWGRVRARKLVTCEGWMGSAAFDVAALVLEAPVPDVTPLRLGTIAEGDLVSARGFGTGMVVRSMPLTPWHTFDSTRSSRQGKTVAVVDEVIAVEMPTHGGDSGGPILNADGELVAITSHGREGDKPLTLGARVDACATMIGDALTR